MATDTTDRELLKLAAKAAGYEVLGDLHPADAINILIRGRAWSWRPLIDDGDALRLSVALSLDLSFLHEAGNINRACKLISVDCGGPWTPCVREDVGADPLAATRRAIVRAAAEIGRKHHG